MKARKVIPEEAYIQVRRANERGHADHGWLNTFHTFSFSDYYDPEFMGFRTLRVINEDWVGPGQGFPTHAHRDMEIITCVLEGELEHKDSMGNGSILKPGQFQRMSAGTGVKHSEFNPSQSNPLHLYQIWILPERNGIEPGYEEENFPLKERDGNLRLVASRDGRAGSLKIHQDVNIYTTLLNPGELIEDRLESTRFSWFQVMRGVIEVNDHVLSAGDGLAMVGGGSIELKAAIEGDAAELLLFDMG